MQTAEGYFEDIKKGQSLIENGKADQAIVHFRQIAHQAEKEHNMQILLQSLLGAAEAAETAVIGEISSYYRDACAYLDVVYKEATALEDLELIGRASLMKGILSLDISFYKKAEEDLQIALSMFEKNSSHGFLAHTYSVLAELYAKTNRIESALSYLKNSDQHLWQVPELGLIKVKCGIIKALILFNSGEIDQAKEIVFELISWLEADHIDGSYYRLKLIVYVINHSLFKGENLTDQYKNKVDPYVFRAVELRYYR